MTALLWLLRNPKIAGAILLALTLVSAGTWLYVKGRMDANHKQVVASLQEDKRRLEQSILRNERLIKEDKERAEKDAATISQYEDRVDELLRNIEKPDTQGLTGPDTDRLLDAWDVFEGKPSPRSSK